LLQLRGGCQHRIPRSRAGQRIPGPAVRRARAHTRQRRHHRRQHGCPHPYAPGPKIIYRCRSRIRHSARIDTVFGRGTWLAGVALGLGVYL